MGALFVSSHLGLFYLSLSHKKETRLKWVNLASETLLYAQWVAQDQSFIQNRLDWANSETNLSIHWPHIPFVDFAIRRQLDDFKKAAPMRPGIKMSVW